MADGTEGTAGAGGGDAAAVAAAAAAAAANAAKPWYEGKADADTLGHWQNKLGADAIKDPATVALEMTKQAREAQRFVGVPPEQLIRLPKDAKDEAGWAAVHQRLGAPKDAKDYDFSAVKSSNGTPIDPAFAEHIRATAAKLHLSKDAAATVAAEMVKFKDNADKAGADELAAKLETDKALLAKSWGTKEAENKLTAMQGARRLGVTPEEVAALEKVVGYGKVMEMFRKVGAGTSEDTFVEGARGSSPKTMESAQARLNELMADRAWGERLVKGDAATVREFNSLTEQVTGVSAAAA